MLGVAHLPFAWDKSDFSPGSMTDILQSLTAMFTKSATYTTAYFYGCTVIIAVDGGTSSLAILRKRRRRQDQMASSPA